ncbi:hypothetical protein CD798_03470 [Bacillaceae bacterium SAOS 7]|nr:hypothetical protein CD798_03470 [Bacillaceae bacterium SAOS 7]
MNIKRMAISLVVSLVIAFLFSFVLFFGLIYYQYAKIDAHTLQETHSFTVFGLEYYRINVTNGETKGIPNNDNMSLAGFILWMVLFFSWELRRKMKRQ